MTRPPHRRRRPRAGAFSVAMALAVTLVAPACSSGSSSQGGSSGTLRVLGGSELKDMAPILDAARKATGVKVDLQYTGSLDGAERIARGEATLDAAWFASDKYVALAEGSAKVLDHRPVMLCPVVVGVRKSAAARLGWGEGAKVGWADIAKAAAAGQFHFAMTSAAASNSGFSALVGLASALAGGQALDTAAVDAAGLRGFFTGQALTAGSSGFLSDAYVRDQDRLDGMVNYESVLMALNASGKLHDPLVLVYPAEGIVTADYPLMLLNPGVREAYGKLVDYLRRPAVQRRIEQLTFRRPAVPGVPLEGGFPSGLLVEAPFPANLAVVRRLLDDYQTELRRPAHTVYVLDLSGSMGGDRLDLLKAALAGLAGADTSFTGHFARFAPREKVTLITFSDDVIDTKNFDVDSSDPESAGLVAVRQTVGGFQAGGNTAIYTALQQAYRVAATARAGDAGAFVSIVLMTDGENNRGVTSEEFLRFVRGLPPDQAGIHVYAVLFGGADPKALQAVADATGGRVFDARTADLSGVFKEIRGYQ